MYVINITNMGYNSEWINILSGVENDDLEKIKRLLKRRIKNTTKKIDGFKVTSINLDFKVEDFDNSGSVMVLTTDDVDRCIEIVKI